MRLKNEADLATQSDELCPCKFSQSASQHHRFSFLHCTQRTDQGEQGGLPGAGWTSQDCHLTRHEVEIDVVQYLFRILLAAVTMTNPLHTYGQPGGCFCAHQKSSAGSSMITLRTARSPAAMHIELVRIKTTPTRKTVNRVTTPVVAVNIA